MRRAALLLGLLAACQGLPPRTDDRSDPVAAYRTFRGAVARREYDREWDCLSDRIRAQFGVRDRAAYKDLRVVADDHIAFYGIRRSEVEGEPEVLSDGRVQLELDLPLAFRGRVVLRPVLVLKVFAEGVEEPVIHQHLARLDIRATALGLLVRLPSDLARELDEWGSAPGDRATRIEAGISWMLDDFGFGDETPASVGRLAEKKTGSGE